MNKELYVSSTPHETKVGLTEDDQLAEVFFERENEYTLAGSIYKGRVTRVLPGMQSAFVDIGLERDAFLYVSDFLELAGDEEDDEDFGEIPAPRGAIDVGKPQAALEADNQSATAALDVDEEAETFTDDFSAAAPEPLEEATESAAGEDGEGARRWRGRRRRRGGRRGGRGNEPETRSESTSNAALPSPSQFEATPTPPARSESRPEQRPEPRPEQRSEQRYEPRSRSNYAAPTAYAPIILPGESISKYRNLAPAPVENPVATEALPTEEAPPVAAASPVEGMAHGDIIEAGPWTETEEIAEEAAHLDQGFTDSETEGPQTPTDAPAAAATQTEAAPVAEERSPRRGRWWARRKAAAAAAEHEQAVRATEQTEAPVVPELKASASEDASHQSGLAELTRPDDASHLSNSDERIEPLAIESEQTAAAMQAVSEDQEEREEQSAAEAEREVDTPAGSFELRDTEQLAAPSVAPAGRTLEHEVLDEEEAEFAPVPDDVNAMREVAGDEELVLEEETLDAGNGYSERWVPKIADVDEDDVVAAEMRGEKIYEAEETEDAEDEDQEEEEEEEEDGDEEPVNDHAEVRASTPTVGYQQRNPQRPAYDRNRNYRDRSRRGGGPRRNNIRARNGNRNQPLITDLLKEGQEVLIQIAKEPIGKKGARITSHIALPGRFLVYMPTVNHVGVSRKISSEEERMRLKRIVTSERENGLGGFIVRTAAVNIKEEDLRADIRFLKHLWAEIKTRAENSKSPALIYHDLNLVERVLRDQVNADFSQIWVDTEDEYERVVRFANRFQPSLVRRIKLYTKDTPLFEQFGIQDEINRSLKSKVWLKSGGHIVINQTEALVAIDVNTGKFVGKTQRLEDTIVKVNVDAIKEIVRQIRLRDLGGIIVIDFIDMDERKNRQKVMIALEEALRNDRAPSKVLQFNDFGLVAITRKRVKQSLERTLGEPCPYCTGAGFVKSVPTVCNELYIEMRKMAKIHDKSDIVVRVNPEVAKALKASNGKQLGELEELTGKTVLVKSDPALHQEMFDIH
jgi:Rne/Rng family ribonuclease